VGTQRRFILMPAQPPWRAAQSAAAMWVAVDTTFPRFAVEAWDRLDMQWQAYVRLIKRDYMHLIEGS